MYNFGRSELLGERFMLNNAQSSWNAEEEKAESDMSQLTAITVQGKWLS